MTEPSGSGPVRLRTPEQVAEDLGRDEQGRPIITATTIRRLARGGTVAVTRLPRNKIALTQSQVDAMLDAMTDGAPPAPARLNNTTAESQFGQSARSTSRHQKK